MSEPSVLPARTNGPRWRLRAKTPVGDEQPAPLSNQEAPTLPQGENDKKWSSAVVGCARRRSAHDDRKESELPPAEDIGE